MSEKLDDPSQVARRGDTINVALWYPPCDAEPTGTARYIEVDLVAVRAADSFRVHYDFARDGYAVERPKRSRVLVKSTDTIDTYEERVEWVEEAFLPSWPFGDSGELPLVNWRARYDALLDRLDAAERPQESARNVARRLVPERANHPRDASLFDAIATAIGQRDDEWLRLVARAKGAPTT